jgi:uncharacterized protein YecE (DUF72 family)
VTVSARAWVGTSGWQYRDWQGPFYPRELPSDAWLSHYASTFSTTEVNNTFYGLPPRDTFVRWADRTPDDFLMAIKASRYLTHIVRLREPREPVDRLLDAASGLGLKLGPVLVQLPPTFAVDLDRLTGLIEAVAGRVRIAVEFRHPSWRSNAVYATLRSANAAVVLADRPGAHVEPVVTADWTYIRFHQGTDRAAAYRRSKLHRWAERLAGLPVDEAFVYFNNDPGGAAPRDAAVFREMLEARGFGTADQARRRSSSTVSSSSA